MPPRDPRLCPVLERALPADFAPSAEIRHASERWLILFGDNHWHPVLVRAWRQDRFGRDIADVEWHAAADTWAEAYVVDLDRMRDEDGD
jgi:hypothetical protein